MYVIRYQCLVTAIPILLPIWIPLVLVKVREACRGWTSDFNSEVRRELEDYKNEYVQDGIKKFRSLFATPLQEEQDFVTVIYTVQHFHQNIPKQTLLKGGKNADPWVIARAAILEGIVVSNEVERPNAARIPNICEHFRIKCINFETFMDDQNWTF